MQIPANEELRQICQAITSRSLSGEQWAKIESSDMFQSTSFCGGFDADEKAFLFSWYADEESEYWFQLSIEEANLIASGDAPPIEGRLAEG